MLWLKNCMNTAQVNIYQSWLWLFVWKLRNIKKIILKMFSWDKNAYFPQSIFCNFDLELLVSFWYWFQIHNEEKRGFMFIRNQDSHADNWFKQKMVHKRTSTGQGITVKNHPQESWLWTMKLAETQESLISVPY